MHLSDSISPSGDLTLLAIGDVHLGTRPSSLPEDLASVGVDPRDLTPEAALTAEIAGIYMSAARNRRDIRIRQEETDAAGLAIENMKPPPSGYRDEFGEAVLDRLADLVGDDA